MKLLFITHTSGLSGSSVALFNLIKELKELKDINCLYVVFPKKGIFATRLEELGINCIFLNNYYLTIYPPSKTYRQKVTYIYQLARMLYKNLNAEMMLCKTVRQIQPDIIHSNVGPLDIGYNVAKKLGISHVWHLREYQDLDFNLHFFPSKLRFNKMQQSSFSHSIAITKGVFDYWHLNNTKDVVIYDGVIPSEEHNYIAAKENYFLFVGRIEEAKGIKNLLNAFAKFCNTHSTYSLYIAGTGVDSYINECRELVKELRIVDRVKFLGYINGIGKYMEKALALIVASRFEGFGFITAEAMYNHCLVIGKNTAGTKEQFDVGLNELGKEIGFRFEFEYELLAVLETVIALPEDKYKDISSRAYSIVRMKYALEKHATEVRELYVKILQNI